jgi:lipopolysaccharide-binding protein
MNTFIVFILFCLISCLSSVNGQQTNAGVKAVVSQAAVDYVKSIFIPKLEQQVLSTTIPDVSGTATSPIGSLTYDLSSIQMQSFVISQAVIQFQPPSDLQIVITVAADLTMHWQYKENSWPHVSDSGTADITAAITVALVLQGAVGANGQPACTVVSCASSVDNIDVTFHGGASWLYNLFISIVRGVIKENLQNALNANIPPIIAVLMQMTLTTIPTTVPVDGNTLTLNYQLIQAPYVPAAGGFVTADFKGSFVATDVGEQLPGQPVAMPDSVTGSMLQILLSAWTMNSIPYAYMTDNKLQGTVTAADVPSGQAYLLNTDTISTFIPELGQLYPSAQMQIEIAAVQSPSIDIEDNEMTFSANAQVTFDAWNALLQQYDDVFAVNIQIMCDISLSLSFPSGQVVISGFMKATNLTAQLVSSNVGNFDVAVLSGKRKQNPHYFHH